MAYGGHGGAGFTSIDANHDGKITVDGRAITITAERAGDYVSTSVADHGAGIDAPEQDLIFEKFYREPGRTSRVQGVGLGLSVVKHTMDAHGGTIAVHSAPGRAVRGAYSNWGTSRHA